MDFEGKTLQGSHLGYSTVIISVTNLSPNKVLNNDLG